MLRKPRGDKETILLRCEGSRAKGEELCHVQPRWLEATGSTVALAVISNVGANLCKVFLREASQFAVIISVNVILRACSFVASGGIPVAMAEEKDIAEERRDAIPPRRLGQAAQSLHLLQCRGAAQSLHCVTSASVSTHGYEVRVPQDVMQAYLPHAQRAIASYLSWMPSTTCR